MSRSLGTLEVSSGSSQKTTTRLKLMMDVIASTLFPRVSLLSPNQFTYPPRSRIGVRGPVAPRDRCTRRAHKWVLSCSCSLSPETQDDPAEWSCSPLRRRLALTFTVWNVSATTPNHSVVDHVLGLACHEPRAVDGEPSNMKRRYSCDTAHNASCKLPLCCRPRPQGIREPRFDISLERSEPWLSPLRSNGSSRSSVD